MEEYCSPAECKGRHLRAKPQSAAAGRKEDGDRNGLSKRVRASFVQISRAPFWAWNTKLDRDTILKQIDVFREMGMGGFTMHCRTGLNTPYLGEEFLDVVKACVDKAGALQMKACLYDEDRWPSGACGGAVTKDPEFRSRYLVFTPFSKEEGTWPQGTESISAAKGVFTGKGYGACPVSDRTAGRAPCRLPETGARRGSGWSLVCLSGNQRALLLV